MPRSPRASWTPSRTASPPWPRPSAWSRAPGRSPSRIRRGIARADFLSPRNPEKSTIRVTAAGLTADLNLDVAFIDPAAAVGTAYSFPNPFHPPEQPATIAWKITDNATVTLRVYTQTGNLVLRKEFPSGGPGGQAGLNQFVWDGKNGKGELVSSGGYIVMIEAPGTGVIRRKMAVVR